MHRDAPPPHAASCTPGLTPDDAGYAVEDDCHYYSFMYFRSDAALDTGDAVNATYRKIMVLVGIGVLLVRCANAKDSKVGMGKTPSKQEV